MVVLARPRDESRAHVTLEEDDVTEDYLEKPYVELLGDTADCSTLQRSLSARVRRRERVGTELWTHPHGRTSSSPLSSPILPSGEIPGAVRHGARPPPPAAPLQPELPAQAAST